MREQVIERIRAKKIITIVRGVYRSRILPRRSPLAASS